MPGDAKSSYYNESPMLSRRAGGTFCTRYLILGVRAWNKMHITASGVYARSSKVLVFFGAPTSSAHFKSQGRLSPNMFTARLTYRGSIKAYRPVVIQPGSHRQHFSIDCYVRCWPLHRVALGRASSGPGPLVADFPQGSNSGGKWFRPCFF